MSYTPAVAAALSGASQRQLSYWRRGSEALVRPEQAKARGRVFYSYQDVVALRTTVYLRGRDVPLQRIRKAVQALRAMGQTEHLSAYRLVSIGKDIVWRESGAEAVALTGQPGQKVIAQMVDILAAFQDVEGNEIAPLHRPAPGLNVDLEVRSGYPVIEGTRVPYDLVAALLADGIEPARIADIYPSVSAEAAAGALVFAQRVGATLHAAS